MYVLLHRSILHVERAMCCLVLQLCRCCLAVHYEPTPRQDYYVQAELKELPITEHPLGLL
jgi:hypothetical protein